jgi:cytidyltransferase-like protein
MQSKIFEFLQLDRLVDQINDKKAVLVGGSFDLMHYGHVTFLKNAKKEGDILIIALESDDFSKKKKKKVPVHNQQQRAEILGSLYMVDYVLKLPLFENHSDYFNLVKSINPSVIAVTEGDTMIEKKQEQAKAIGATVKTVCPRLEKFSSSNIASYEKIFSD